jgi:hypothetical protein
MLWDKELFSGNTLKVVRFHRFSERYFITSLCAKDHHVVKIATCFFYSILRRRLILSENTAGWEDVLDGVNHDADRWKREVAGIVLHMLVACIYALSNDLQ